MSAARQLQYYTIDDIYNLPEGERAELIDGELYMMATPSRVHQGLVSELTYLIRDYIKKKNGDCKVYPAPIAVYLNADDRLYLEPDIIVVCDKDKLVSDGCKGAPDWVIEIVSPSSVQMDYNKKLFKYEEAGVREYWIVDPVDMRITVYSFEHDTFGHYKFTDKVKADIYEDFEIDFSGISIE